MLRCYLGFLITFLSMNIQLSAQDYLPLYPDVIPNSNKTINEEKSDQSNSLTIVRKISVPAIRYFAASEKNATGTAVIIFPGGGYETNSITHEGEDVARKFNEIGVTAFVVKYRIPNVKTMPDKEIGPLQDAQRAIRLIRANAAKWNLQQNKIGIMGVSAGGHLAAMLTTAGSILTTRSRSPITTIPRSWASARCVSSMRIACVPARASDATVTATWRSSRTCSREDSRTATAPAATAC